MAEKHYIDGAGLYVGLFVDEAEPPVGAVEVPSQPPDAITYKWDGAAWVLDAAAVGARKDARATLETSAVVARALVDEIYPFLTASKPTKAALLLAIKENVKARL